MTTDALLIYVHGAGDQGHKDAAQLKTGFDQALFGGPGPSEAVPWWQVFWDRKDGPRKEAALDETIRELAQHPSTPDADAAALLAAIRKARPPVRRRGGGEEAVQAGGPDRAQEAIAGYYASATSLAGPEEMPDWIFRILAGQASADVVPYLYDGWAKRMRRPLVTRLREIGNDRPLVVLAHSLGSILAYDVVTDPAFATWDIRLFVTAGTPLGIQNVRAKVRDGQGPGPMPPATMGWQNFHDSRDKVGWFGETLAGKYPDPPPLTQKLTVRNDEPDHHALTGYLVDPDVQRVVRAAVGR